MSDSSQPAHALATGRNDSADRDDSARLETARAPAFANPGVLVPGWFVLARSRAVRRGTARTVEVGPRQVAVWRNEAGAVHASDAVCGHLGADLGKGRVVDGALECPFHHWRWGVDGRCSHVPGRDEPHRSRSICVWTAVERWGFVWAWVGSREPAFALPDVPDDGRYRLWRPPAQQLACHPHLVVANGLDGAHVSALHGIDVVDGPHLSLPDEYRVQMDVRGHPHARALRAATGTRRRELAATFTTHGASIAWASFHTPVRFHVLFTGRPSGDGASHTQSLLFAPRAPHRTLRAIAIMYALLHHDRQVLDGLRFTGAYAEQDAGLCAVADVAERLARLC